MYTIPTASADQWPAILRRSTWRGAWLGLVLGTAYGVALLTVSVVSAIVQDGMTAGELLRSLTGLVSLSFFFGGIPAGAIGALTGLAVGFQLKRRPRPVPRAQAVAIGLRTSLCIVALVNGIHLIGLLGDGGDLVPGMVNFALFLVLPSIIYGCASVFNSIRMAQC